MARELLTESGSIFVQIGDENVHLVRTLLDEVFGADNFVRQITFKKTGRHERRTLAGVGRLPPLVRRDRERRQVPPALSSTKRPGDDGARQYTLDRAARRHATPTDSRDETDRTPLPLGCPRLPARPADVDELRRATDRCPVEFDGQDLSSRQPNGIGRRTATGMTRLAAGRSARRDRADTLRYVRYLDDFPVVAAQRHLWTDTRRAASPTTRSMSSRRTRKVIERCLLMTTDPGDLVLDPTCGSGTTAYVAEQWGRRWITIDTSRVALALARSRLMAAKYPYYLLADSEAGIRKEAELTGQAPPSPIPPTATTSAAASSTSACRT